MEEIIKVAGEYYVLATSSLADDRRRVIKQAKTFAVLDRYGDVQPVGLGEQGLYHDGTRHLSRLEFQVEGERPLLLSSNVTRENLLVAVDLTNPDTSRDHDTYIPRGALHILRTMFLWEGVLHERFRLSNYGSGRVMLRLGLKAGADFADIFEVRGEQRRQRGRILDPAVEGAVLRLAYEGLDGILRHTDLAFSRVPDEIRDSEALFDCVLDAGEETDLYLTVTCRENGAAPDSSGYQKAYRGAITSLKSMGMDDCGLSSSNEQYNEFMERSLSDLRILLTREEGSYYPYAGIPWYSAPFGRDGIITALETLWYNPDMARGVLIYLARHQATELNDLQDAEPGKILHEMRMGEMCATGEIPFGRYYGSADATPLFVVLASEYLKRTGDLPFIEGLWENVERALAWIDEYGDRDGDGFVEYLKRSEYGLTNQGWKDSGDSIFHADGTMARGPIALCEVQGYVFAAKNEAALMAESLGNRKRAMELFAAALEVRKRFEEAFWDEELGGYVLALDGDKKPCRVLSSNMGHVLFAGAASQERAERVAELLMDRDFNCGWGIRTIAKGQARYNPMSYHNGSVWPHDNALIAAGFARYGLKEKANKIMNLMFHVSQSMDLNRLPELFCGFQRRPGDGPTLYPVACSPQAWASAAPFYMLQSCLGLEIRALDRRIVFERPGLPRFLDNLRITNLRVGNAAVDLLFTRHGQDVSLHIERRQGDVTVTLNK